MSGKTLPSAIAREWLLPMAAALLGLAMAHHPMILSGMSGVQTDLGDSRLIHYMLEHSYLWTQSVPFHRDFWSPPIFYPARNATAYSDALLTVAPPYWLFRELGAAHDTAFQLWMMSMSAINFAAGYLLFRRGLRLAAVPASAGAFLIAFGASRINQLGHQQLLPYFYCLMTLYALVRVFSERTRTLPMRSAWWIMASLGLASQLYAGFYHGWFLILAIGLAAIWSLLLHSYRGPFLAVLREDWLAIVCAGAVGFVALIPFFRHYLAAAAEIGPRDFFYVRMSILMPWSWFHMGPYHWLWSGLAGLDPFRNLTMEVEHRIGMGLVTPVVCGVGLFVARDRPLGRLVAILTLTLIVLGTSWPGTVIANLGVVAVVLIVSGTLHGRGPWTLRAVLLGMIAGLVLNTRFPSWRVVALGFLVIEIGLAESFRLRHRPKLLVFPLLPILLVCWKFFDVTVMGLGFAIVLPCVVAAEILHVPDRVLARLVGLTAWLVFLAAISFSFQPEALVAGAIFPLLFLPIPGAKWPQIASRRALLYATIAMAAIVVFQANDALWIYVFRYVPGGSAIRAVARVALLLLVPAAFGLACFLASPWAKRHPILTCLIVLVCVLEQGLTTPTFDKFAERRHISQLASRVDRRATTFYYHPSSGNVPAWMYHLDAMWASRLAGVPTINGYTGGSPRGWGPLVYVDVEHGPTVEEALREWIQWNSLPPEQVQWIGGR